MIQDFEELLLNPWVKQIASAFIVAVISYLLLQGLKAFTQRRLAGAKQNRAPWAEDLLKKTRWPLRFIMAYLAIAASLQAAPLITEKIPTLATIAKITWILLCFWLLDRIAVVGTKHSRLPATFTSNTRTLLLTIHRILFTSLALLIILDTLGISITPILASLGVGSIAVALALQDTLNNFFSGIYILVDRPIRVGDYVKVDGGGPEGYVRRIGWRSTHIQKTGDNLSIIPNSKLSSANLINFDLPVVECPLAIGLGVAYNSDLEKVERTTLTVAREVLQKVPGGVADFEPSLRFHTFADSSINFTVNLRVKRFEDSALIRHEFIKALNARYNQDGIEIPFPQRVVTNKT